MSLPIEELPMHNVSLTEDVKKIEVIIDVPKVYYNINNEIYYSNKLKKLEIQNLGLGQLDEFVNSDDFKRSEREHFDIDKIKLHRCKQIITTFDNDKFENSLKRDGPQILKRRKYLCCSFLF